MDLSLEPSDSRSATRRRRRDGVAATGLAMVALLGMFWAFKTSSTRAWLPLGWTHARGWIEVDSIHTIFRRKKLIPLSDKIARKIFRADFPHLDSDWRRWISVPIESEPIPPEILAIPRNQMCIGSRVTEYDPNWSPNARDSEFFIPPRDAREYVQVAAFSEDELHLFVLQQAGSHLGYWYYECRAAFRVRRNQEWDAWLQLTELRRRYGLEYRGLRQGTGVAKVQAILGKCDAARLLQPSCWSVVFYFRDDAIVESLNFRILGISPRVPDNVKKSRSPEGWVP